MSQTDKKTAARRASKSPAADGGFAGKAASAIFIMLLTLLPLYYENSYFNITAAKLHIFVFIAAASLLLIFISALTKAPDTALLLHSPATVIPVALLVICYTVSLALCAEPRAAFFGDKGWGAGLLTIAAAVVIFLFLSQNLKNTPALWLPAIAVFDIVALLAILYFARIDLLGMHEGISATPHFYLSTIGNINRFAGYLTLLTPMSVVFFLSTEDRLTQAILAFSLILASACVFLSLSDSVYAGLGFCLFFAFPFVLRDKKRTLRLAALLVIFGLTHLLCTILPCFSEQRSLAEGLSRMLLDIRVSAAMLTFGIASYILARFCGKKTRFAVCALLETALAAIVAVCIVHAVKSFGDEWGTSRGLIWKESLAAFGRFSVKQKLFGVGPELLYKLYGNVEKAFDMRCLTAHSAPLQVLLSTGIFGLGAYILAWASLLCAYIKSKKTSDIAAFFLPLAAYFAQSLFNSATVINIGTATVIAACFIRFSNKKTT